MTFFLRTVFCVFILASIMCCYLFRILRMLFSPQQQPQILKFNINSHCVCCRCGLRTEGQNGDDRSGFRSAYEDQTTGKQSFIATDMTLWYQDHICCMEILNPQKSSFLWWKQITSVERLLALHLSTAIICFIFNDMFNIYILH